jgi:hypothetical protein
MKMVVVFSGCCSKHVWNVGRLLPDYTEQQPRRQPSCFVLCASLFALAFYVPAPVRNRDMVFRRVGNFKLFYLYLFVQLKEKIMLAWCYVFKKICNTISQLPSQKVDNYWRRTACVFYIRPFVPVYRDPLLYPLLYCVRRWNWYQHQ